MNKAQAKALFERYAILFGSIDAVPEQIACAILGQEAIEFTHKMGKNYSVKLWDTYGIGSYSANYLTLAGFLVAVTYNNVAAVAREGRTA